MSVSVIIPAYNAEGVITRAIESVANQTLRPLEIIVVSDASTDGTVSVVSKLKENIEYIRIVELEKNGGPARARNEAFKLAAGDWLALLDADDAWKTNRLYELVKHAEHIKADIMADNLILFDRAAGRAERMGFEPKDSLIRVTAKELFKRGIQESSDFDFALLKPIIKRQFIREHSLLYDENIRYAEDFEFYARCLMAGANFFMISDAFYLYTTRIGAISKKKNPDCHSFPRYDLMAEANTRFKEQFDSKLDDEFREIIDARGLRLMAIHRANVARLLRKDKKLIKYSKYVLGHPDLLGLLVRRTWLRTLGKFY